MEPVPSRHPDEQRQLKVLHSGGLMGKAEHPHGTVISFPWKHTLELVCKRNASVSSKEDLIKRRYSGVCRTRSFLDGRTSVNRPQIHMETWS